VSLRAHIGNNRVKRACSMPAADVVSPGRTMCEARAQVLHAPATSWSRRTKPGVGKIGFRASPKEEALERTFGNLLSRPAADLTLAHQILSVQEGQQRPDSRCVTGDGRVLCRHRRTFGHKAKVARSRRKLLQWRTQPTLMTKALLACLLLASGLMAGLLARVLR